MFLKRYSRDEEMQIQTEKILDLLKCTEPCSSYEGLLQARWNRIPRNVPLRLRDGGTLVVLFRGNWNVESGPDFKNARLEINGKTLDGDVEVHRFESDWARHAHSANPDYAHVILHVVEISDRGEEGLPVYQLPPEEQFADLPPPLLSRLGSCAAKFDRMEDEEIREMFIAAGVERMHHRSEVILHDMIKNGVPRAFQTRLFDAYGFKHNRQAFGLLLETLWRNYPESVIAASFESLLWGESGLLPVDHSGRLPEDAAENAKQLWERWWHLRKDSGCKIEWRRNGGRPWNTPERRLAGLCLFLRKFGMNPLPRWLDSLREAPSAPVFCRRLLDELILKDAFWDWHTTFFAAKLKHPAAVSGMEKALEIAVDVIMPALRAYCLLKRDVRMGNRVDAAFRNLPGTQKNRIFLTALDRWFSEPGKMAKMFSDAASRQGVLHLYSNFCSSISCDCRVCLIHQTMSSKC